MKCNPKCNQVALNFQPQGFCAYIDTVVQKQTMYLKLLNTECYCVVILAKTLQQSSVPEQIYKHLHYILLH